MQDDVARLLHGGRGRAEWRDKCPSAECRGRKKKNERTLSLRVEGDGLLYHCHHCGEKGRAPLTDKPKTRPKVNMPPPAPIQAARIALTETALEGPHLQLLRERGITDDVAKRYGVTGAVAYFHDLQRKAHAVAFPYTNQGVPYAHKLRCVDEKLHTQNGSCQTLMGLDLVDSGEELYIAEGEWDALSLAVAGYKGLSIPGGALKEPTESDGKFAFLRHAQAHVDAAPRIMLAMDADGPGDVMAEEIARRIGRWKCFRVQYPKGCKDANDVLLKHGTEELRRCVDTAEPWPVDGLYSADTFKDQLLQIYQEGLPPCVSTGFDNLDEIYTIQGGDLVIVTGNPGGGKSELIDNIMWKLAGRDGWRFAICSFENSPELHMAKMITRRMGKQFFSKDIPIEHRLSPGAFADGLKWVADHFYYVVQPESGSATIDSVLERARVAVLRHGIKGLLIDPYNYIVKPKSGGEEFSETDWISDMLTKVRGFARAYDVVVWFVAHPKKLDTRADGSIPMPGPYHISGSAAWFAKADMGLSIGRKEGNVTQMDCWKVRYSWRGSIGTRYLEYDTNTFRYSEYAGAAGGGFLDEFGI